MSCLSIFGYEKTSERNYHIFTGVNYRRTKSDSGYPIGEAVDSFERNFTFSTSISDDHWFLLVYGQCADFVGHSQKEILDSQIDPGSSNPLCTNILD